MTTATKTPTENLVYRSFEIVSESGDDITPAVYDKFFARCPESKALMSHIDDIVRGKMMDEVYRILLADDFSDDQAYLDWEVRNHEDAYSVEVKMYGVLLDALAETVQEKMGADWNADYERAWTNKNATLMQEIEKRFIAC